jgi:hypothetical protein
MFNKADFENIIWDFIFTYRQLLLHGNFHKRVNHEAYEKNIATWNTLLLSLETGVILGLAKILERDKDFGREFEDTNLNIISSKIIKIRHTNIAHSDLSKKRDPASFLSFLQENQLTGSDIILMFDALKDRAIQYQKTFKFEIDVQSLFTQSQNNALKDLDDWLKSFKTEL